MSSGMDRLMRKLGAEQAAKQTAGLSAFFKKVQPNASEQEHPDSEANKTETNIDSERKQTVESAEDNGSVNLGPRDSSVVREDSQSPVDPTSPVKMQTEAASPGQGVEPSGTTETSLAAGGGSGDATEDESDADGSPLKRLRRVRRPSDDSDAEQPPTEGKSSLHRRIRAADDEDAEETGENQDRPEKDPSVEKKYFQDVKVVDEGADSDEADGAPTQQEDSEEEEMANEENKTMVRLEDFDDEEEFLLAGGDVQEAKKRKEWGLHHSDDEQEEEDEQPKEDKKSAQAEMRKIYRESERILREKRCMIPPSQAPRLSFSGLFQKLDEKSKALQPTSDQKVNVSPQPAAPLDESLTDASVPSGLMLEDDDDLSELVFTDQPEVTAVNSEPTVAVATVNSEPTVALKSEVAATSAETPLSPPVARRAREELRSKLRQSAFARSEHVVLNPQTVVKVEGPALSEAPVTASHFIAAESFEGCKVGYVFHMGARGLGYYSDEGPNKNRHSEAAVEPQSMNEDAFCMPVTDSQEVDINMEDTQVLDTTAGKEEGKNVAAARVLDLQYDAEETQTQTVGKGSKPSMFRSFIGVDEGTAVMHSAAADTTLPIAEKEAVAASRAAPRRAYGRSATVTKADNEQEGGIAVEDARVGEEVERAEDGEEQKDDFGWREPTLDEDEDGEEADDEDGSEEEEEEEDSDDDDDDESDDDEVAKEPEKKTLNDVVSIKKQSALRLGTLEAGYLRNEHEALGISEDIGTAKEDLEEGIDLMDTDGEDNEEELEEDSEEERKVAEGFIEDAKFAVQDMDPEAYKDFHQRMQEDDEQRMTDRILDVVRGEARRRKVQGGEEWIPNRNARQRLLNQMNNKVDENGFAIADNVPSVEDAATNEEVAAQIAAAHAKEKAERIKFQQQKRLEEAQKLDDEDPEEEGAGRAEQGRAVPLLRRNTSHCGPQLSAFSRQLSFSAQALQRGNSKPAGLQRSSSLLRRPATSLLGTAAGGAADAKEEKKIATSKNFFFDKKSKSQADTEGPNSLAPNPDLAALPMKRGTSTSALPFARKAQKTEAPAKRFNMIEALDKL